MICLIFPFLSVSLIVLIGFGFLKYINAMLVVYIDAYRVGGE